MARKIGFNIYTRNLQNSFLLREGITDFVLDKEEDLDEDERL
jgi:hypothetical protein